MDNAIYVINRQLENGTTVYYMGAGTWGSDCEAANCYTRAGASIQCETLAFCGMRATVSLFSRSLQQAA